jgi:hypothetical protein
MQDVQQVIAQADTNDKAKRALEVVGELYRRYGKSVNYLVL